jgi:hypothetical protein
MEPSWSWSMTRFSRSDRRNSIISDDLGHGVGLRADGAGAIRAAQRAHAAHHQLRLLAGQQRHIVLHRNQRLAAHHHGPLLGEIQRHDGDLLEIDVLPHVELGPIGKREDANAFALIDVAVEQVPQLGALVLGVPLAEAVAEGIDAFLGARFFLVAAGAAKGRVVAAGGKRVEQGARLQLAAALLRAQLEGAGAVVDGLAIGVHDQPRADRRAERSRNSIISPNL